MQCCVFSLWGKWRKTLSLILTPNNFIAMKALSNFYRLSDSALEAKCHLIISSLTGNAAFATPVPTLAEIETASANFTSALVAAGTGNRSDIANKNAMRETAVGLYSRLCTYVNFTANGNATLLLTTGFDVSKTPEPKVITKPENLKVLNGTVAGSLLVSVKRVPGAYSYVHQYTTDATLAPDSWVSTAGTTAKLLLTNLTAGTMYYCRVAAVGSNEQIVYSDTVSRIVV